MAGPSSPINAESAVLTMQQMLLNRNRAAVLLFEFLWGVAMPFVYHSTILPGYLRHLGVAAAWIGVAPALHNGVLALVQPLSAYAIQPGVRRVSRMRLAYALGSCAYVLLGLLVLGGLRDPATCLWVTLSAVLGFALAVGTGDPHYMAVVVAAIPPEQRGRYFALRMVCLGLGGIAGGALAEQVLRIAAPLNFGACFLLGGLLYAGSTLSMALYRADPAPELPARAGFGAFLADRLLPQMRERAFRAYLVAVVFFALAACGFSFLGLLLRDRMGESDRLFGLLGAVLMASNLVMSWVLGVVCDRWGPRRGLSLTMLCYAAGILGCLLFRERLLLLACYALAAVWLPGQIIAATDLALRLAARSPASDVTAAMMVTMAPARILGPVLLGVAVDRWSYAPALLACVLCSLCALAALRFTGGPGSLCGSDARPLPQVE